MKYKLVNLGKDYPGRIDDFAAARNYFLEKHEWVLFIDDDEEACDMLLNHLATLEPKYPYYWIRRINLYKGKYRALWNPDFQSRLVSNKVKFIGRVHEKVVNQRQVTLAENGALEVENPPHRTSILTKIVTNFSA